MRISPPVTVTEAALTTNVVEVPPAAYNGATSYDEGDQASDITGTVAEVYESLVNANVGNALSDATKWKHVGTAYEVFDGGPYALDDIVTDAVNHRLFQSLVGSNSNALPTAAESNAYWLYLGASNPWAMFDDKPGTQTVRPDQIAVTVEISGRANIVGLVNIDAAALNVTVHDSTGLVELFNEDFSLVSTEGIVDWWEWSFAPIVREKNYVVRDLPIASNPIISVALSNDGDVACGNCDIGWDHFLGYTEVQGKVGITDYSEKKRDQFGTFYFLERGYSDRGSFTVEVDKDDFNRVKNLLAANRSPMLIIASEIHTSAIYHGIFTDWELTSNHPANATLTTRIEGL